MRTKSGLTVLAMTVLALTALVATLTTLSGANAAQALKFWNLTAETVTDLRFAEPGSGQWGKNQTLNDKDKTVEADERLKLGDVKAGAYDVQVVDAKGRRCVFPNVALSGTGPYAFSISEEEMAQCAHK